MAGKTTTPILWSTLDHNTSLYVIENDRMRISIIGAKGQLGQDCVERLKERTHALLPLDLPEVDITSEQSVQAALREFAPDAIINCAAYTNVDACETEQDAAMAVNANGPRNLARFAEKTGAWLFHVSTDYVFPGDRAVPQPYTETDTTGPVSQYGITKLCGEKAVAEETARFTILRTAWLYGASGHNFLKAILKRALTFPNEPLRVVNDQFGSPTWSRSLAEQIIALLGQPVQGVCHAISEGYCSWHYLAAAFLQEMNLPNEVQPCTTVEFPRPAPRPANSILDNSRLKQSGLNVMKHWQVDLQEFVGLHHEQLIQECVIAHRSQKS
jgi:dTDP-4-dehydrorhamnose reductase